MTYFDMSPIERQIHDAVYGGSKPNSRLLTKELQRRGGFPPQAIAAIRYENGGEVRLKQIIGGHGCLFLIHQNLAYLSLREKTDSIREKILESGFACGSIHSCGSVGELIYRIRDAVVSLRASQLEAIAKKRGAAPSWSDEVHARQESLKAFRSSKQFQKPVRIWLDIVLLRHYRYLNRVRWKLIEWLMFLFEGKDEGLHLDYHVGRTIDLVRNTFSISDLVDLFASRLSQLRMLGGAWEFNADNAEKSTHPLIEAALKLLRSHFNTPIGLSDVAGTLGVSPGHLARLFRRETNRTLTDYLQEVRIANAKVSLTETSEGILAIALKSGFTTAEHFHRTFKKSMGLTPRAYRLLNRK